MSRYGFLSLHHRSSYLRADLFAPFLLRHFHLVQSVILGASKPSQITDNLKSLDVLDKLTDEVKAELEVIMRG